MSIGSHQRPRSYSAPGKSHIGTSYQYSLPAGARLTGNAYRVIS